MFRRFGDYIRPEVEKPTAKTTVARPLLLFVLLIGIAILTCVLAALWLLNAGRLIDPLWIGPAIALLTIAYGVQSFTVWPPAIRWNSRATQHRTKLLWLFGIAALAMALYVTGNWPEPRYPGGNFLWYVWQFLPESEGGGLWFGIVHNPMNQIISDSAFVWMRVILLIALPVSVPYAVRLIWYRFGVEIVYPSWADGAIPRGLRWLDPLGLLDIRMPKDDDKNGALIPSAEAMDEGAL